MIRRWTVTNVHCRSLAVNSGNYKIELGNSVWVQEWKEKKPEVTADALLGAEPNIRKIPRIPSSAP